jgi:hypothetical protein
MSHWGATVITNLVTAIPLIGHSIAEFIAILYFNIPTIGKVSPYALFNDRTIREDKTEFKDIPYSFLSMLVGLIDGDGYFSIVRNDKDSDDIKINMTLSLHIRDLSTLEYIQSVLKIGKVSIYSKDDTPHTCKYIINRTDLQEVFLPLLMHHKIYFLTKTRINQYNKLMYIFNNDIIRYSNIPVDINNIPVINKLPSTSLEYSKLPYFNNWIVGFTIADGSFNVKRSGSIGYTLKQREHMLLFEGIKLVFNTTTKITIDKGNYIQLYVSSRKDIQTIINFFSLSNNHPLLGYRLAQYNQWLLKLKESKRYKDLNFPM